MVDTEPDLEPRRQRAISIGGIAKLTLHLEQTQKRAPPYAVARVQQTENALDDLNLTVVTQH
jgi:hypothetical protein